MPKGSAPQQPNPYNTVTPFGSDTFSGKTSGTQTITPSKPVQNYLNSNLATQTALTNKAKGMMGQLPTGKFNAAGLPYNPSSIRISDPSQFQGQADKAAQASFAMQKGMLQPGFDQQNNQEMTSLSDRGIPVGAEVWNREKNLLSSQQNNALQQAAQGAVLTGNQEQQNLFNEQLGGAQEEGNINNQAFQQGLTERALPYNEMSAYMSGQPMALGQQPGAQNISGLQEAGYAGALNQYNQQQSGLANGLFGLGSAALTAYSDRRLKKDIKRIGALDNGLSLFKYRYKWEGDDHPTHVGFMSDEVRDVAPDAVVQDSSGFDAVNYAKAIEATT